MNIKERIEWIKIIEMIKDEHPHIVVVYSSTDGWANLSYKTHFKHITYKMTWNKITSIIYTMHP